MNLLILGTIGLVTQFALLATFVSISRSGFASTGKPVVLVVAVVALGLIIWSGVKRARKITHVLALPLVLALGYLVAFYSLGLIAFPGLLSDATRSSDYIGSVLRVGTALLVIYAVATGLLYLFAKSLHRARHQ
jgi:hypothetical protein